jgi:hypothetical protein
VQQREHKLAPVWEGPFVVSKVLHNGSYYLIDIREEKDRPKNQKRKRGEQDNLYFESTRPWNIAQLRPFYS